MQKLGPTADLTVNSRLRHRSQVECSQTLDGTNVGIVPEISRGFQKIMHTHGSVNEVVLLKTYGMRVLMGDFEAQISKTLPRV